MMSSNVSFCPQPEDIEFTVVEEERKQRIFTFKELESEIFLLVVGFHTARIMFQNFYVIVKKMLNIM